MSKLKHAYFLDDKIEQIPQKEIKLLLFYLNAITCGRSLFPTFLDVLQAIFLVHTLGQDIMPQKITKFHDDPV